MRREEWEEKFNQVMEAPIDPVRTGNYVAVFTILILQDILIELTSNPVTNFNYIIAAANTIASLNSSIKPIQ
ncbi:MAG TPA: hypothetical protein PKA10_10490 [Selenomonadales bacterium]|nr:hypothetical protein [Selenomonadales bacterium]